MFGIATHDNRLVILLWPLTGTISYLGMGTTAHQSSLQSTGHLMHDLTKKYSEGEAVVSIAALHLCSD
ncbi:hypothetical protein CEP52_006670 [Fusarium oligoseptatum]|uniref:Uncharacterized protein n=1 Tax=Fusarium oligoseptatum TaxID=2604345 RepID=A0A428TRL5_9HYPO|nr:hypothetical protein CEP52_006670 [Fusarium oligoseptatum]